MVTLSEKAKGKQRAVDPDEAPASIPVLPAYRNVTVRFTDGIPDLAMRIGRQDSVLDIKRQLREAREELGRRKLRLIHNGKLLPNKTVLYDWVLSSEEQRAPEERDTEAKQRKSDESVGAATSPPPPVWLHCSVGAEMAEGETDDNESRNTVAQIKPLRGFDRLAAAGFSEEDIANFRRTFHSSSASNYLDEDHPIDDDEYDEHARLLEEQWIDSLDNGHGASLSQTSSSSTILQGLLIGFFFPLLPFFFFRSPYLPTFWLDGREQERGSNVIFSRKMQMALILGFWINLTFGVWRYLLAS